MDELPDQELIGWFQIILILMLSVGVLLGSLYDEPQPGAQHQRQFIGN